jgi:nitronate monooxygenase
MTINEVQIPTPIIQGGMGVGVSLWGLASAVANAGGVGVISSAGLRDIVSSILGHKTTDYESMFYAVRRAKELSPSGIIGVNVMCALAGSYNESVGAAIDAGADMVISGAGLPMLLPAIRSGCRTALLPIVSSARALDLIIRHWQRHHKRLPDAVIVEGPMAGGHLGFKFEDIEKPEFQLEVILPPILELAGRYSIPVIAAGGIYTHDDIVRFMKLGASGVQMGTRFLATHECDAPLAYKEAVIAARKEDIIVVSNPQRSPASPCGLPFRILVSSPMYQQERIPRCSLGYVLQKDDKGFYSKCPAHPRQEDPKKFLCICEALLASAGYFAKGLAVYTVGSNAYRIDRLMHVAELMSELRGE